MAVGIGSMVYVGTDMLGVAIVGQAINGLAWGVPGAAADDLDSGRADIKYLGRITGFVRFGLMSAGVVPLLAAPFWRRLLGVQTVLFGASTIIALVGTLFFVTQRETPGGVSYTSNYNLIPLTREFRPFTEDWNRLKSGIKTRWVYVDNWYRKKRDV